MRTTRFIRLAAAVMTLSLVVVGCNRLTTNASNTPPPADKGVVKIAVNPWVGYEANVAVVAYLLENELGYKVELKKLPEADSWKGFETGEVDVILENWGHEDLKKTYIDQKKVAVEIGPTGNNGVIGWYVPKWMVDKYPDLGTWKDLDKYAALFKTPKSAGKGQLLDGDPTFVTNDEALVRNLELDFAVVYSGSEEASIEAAQAAAKQQKPLLFYFYEPQWLHAQAEFVRIPLPPYRPGCDAVPAQVACDYPEYLLDKIVRRDFALKRGDAYELIENFNWSNDDQNEIANDITNNGLSPEQAAEKWIKGNRVAWETWLPENS